MDWIVGGLFCLGALTIVATLLPIWKTTQWWVRVCDFPRFQIAIIALAVFVGFAAVRPPARWADWLFLCALCPRWLRGGPNETSAKFLS